MLRCSKALRASLQDQPEVFYQNKKSITLQAKCKEGTACSCQYIWACWARIFLPNGLKAEHFHQNDLPISRKYISQCCFHFKFHIHKYFFFSLAYDFVAVVHTFEKDKNLFCRYNVCIINKFNLFFIKSKLYGSKTL